MQKIFVSAALLLSSSAVFAEVAPDAARDCFPGAYYRKAVSSVDNWAGIEGIIRLPEPQLDMTRLKPTGRPMDNASIYMGGSAEEQEVDAGLTWEVIREADGSVSTQPKAFRPFWRVKSWNNAPAKPEYYYLPGDVVRMSLFTKKPGTLTMAIEPIERTEASKKFLTDLKCTDLMTTFSITFEAPFAPDGLQEFKRVNAIDISGQEGKGVVPSTSSVVGGEWLEVWLWRGETRLPMAPERFTDMRCPEPSNTVVESTINADRGGEKVEIFATRPKADEASESRPADPAQ
jgi:hypothetical protein